MGPRLAWRGLILLAASWQVAVACNVRELSNIIQNRFRQEVAANCGVLGDKCTFDRDCCKGMECKMSASKEGVDNYCQKVVPLHHVERADIPLADYESAPANEPQTSEEGNWMRVRSEEIEEDKGIREAGKEEYDKNIPTDTLSEIERLQENKRLQLLKENDELERLFTKRDEKELEQLRALKEDAEMDELRRLKEHRLKRRLQLIREIKELRELKAEDNLGKIDDLKNKTLAPPENIELKKIQSEVQDIAYSNDSKPEVEKEQNTQPEEIPPNLEQNNPDYPEQVQTPEVTTLKNKQSIHEGHHHRKHHQQRHRRKEHQETTKDSPSETEPQPETDIIGNTESNTTENATR